MIGNPNDPMIFEILRRLRDLETTAPGGSTAVSRGRTRFVGNESLLVQGSGKVEGWWIVTGTQRVTGRLEGSGTVDWTGPWILRGLGQITGNTTLDGNLSVGTGRITVGPLVLDRLGPAGGRIRSTGQLILGDGSGSVYVDGSTTVAGPLGVTGMTNLTGGLDVSGGPKSFKMDHPSKPGWWLRHGSTESPVSGIEYWGEASIGEDGSACIALPDYFDALAKPEGRVVLVTARGFIADWSDIHDNAFTVAGSAGGRFSWLVKAERHSADFLIEEEQASAG